MQQAAQGAPVVLPSAIGQSPSVITNAQQVHIGGANSSLTNAFTSQSNLHVIPPATGALYQNTFQAAVELDRRHLYFARANYRAHQGLFANELSFNLEAVHSNYE